MGSNSELVRTIEYVLGISLGESVSDSVLLIVTTSFADNRTFGFCVEEIVGSEQ